MFPPLAKIVDFHTVKKMKVLGIESSCDETAIAVVEDGHKILASQIASQADLHALYGGVVPELASRRHSELIFPMIKSCLNEANLQLNEIDLIAATHSPGLLGALLVGLNVGKALSVSCSLPFVGVHHIEAHLYSAFMSYKKNSRKNSFQENPFPALGCVISGGHTLLVAIHDIGRYEMLAHTLDDAMGEAFDKIAVMLGGSYPGGPFIEKLAKQTKAGLYRLKAPQSKQYPWHFSYSGLKTQVLYAIWGQNLKDMKEASAAALSQEQKAALAFAFQETVFKDLADKFEHHLLKYPFKTIWMGGGVCANMTLRDYLEKRIDLPFFWPGRHLCLDNAAMIAGLGFMKYKLRGPDSLNLAAFPRSLLVSWNPSH